MTCGHFVILPSLQQIHSEYIWTIARICDFRLRLVESNCSPCHQRYTSFSMSWVLVCWNFLLIFIFHFPHIFHTPFTNLVWMMHLITNLNRRDSSCSVFTPIPILESLNPKIYPMPDVVRLINPFTFSNSFDLISNISAIRSDSIGCVLGKETIRKDERGKELRRRKLWEWIRWMDFWNLIDLIIFSGFCWRSKLQKTLSLILWDFLIAVFISIIHRDSMEQAAVRWLLWYIVDYLRIDFWCFCVVSFWFDLKIRILEFRELEF